MEVFKTTESLMEQQRMSGLKDIQLCGDGKYRWYYELDMWRNPTILITTFKVFFIAILVMGVILLFIGLINGDELKEMAWIPMAMLIVAGIFVVLVPFSYALLGLMYGGKYVMLFEMDEYGVLNREMEQQFQKAEAIGWLTALMGMVRGSFTTMGQGLLTATRNSSYSTFADVISVKDNPRRHVIKVNEILNKNQVYVRDPQDYDFVLKFIRQHCPKI